MARARRQPEELSPSPKRWTWMSSLGSSHKIWLLVCTVNRLTQLTKTIQLIKHGRESKKSIVRRQVGPLGCKPPRSHQNASAQSEVITQRAAPLSWPDPQAPDIIIAHPHPKVGPSEKPDRVRKGHGRVFGAAWPASGRKHLRPCAAVEGIPDVVPKGLPTRFAPAKNPEFSVQNDTGMAIPSCPRRPLGDLTPNGPEAPPARRDDQQEGNPNRPNKRRRARLPMKAGR